MTGDGGFTSAVLVPLLLQMNGVKLPVGLDKAVEVVLKEAEVRILSPMHHCFAGFRVEVPGVAILPGILWRWW